MSTYVLITIACQKITVRHCTDYSHALEKTGLKKGEVMEYHLKPEQEAFALQPKQSAEQSSVLGTHEAQMNLL